ncbi:MAG: hypothetical protein EBY30_18160, partial [Rhodospirillales bacterium]|nr:hypothetical protein [Rhodospirillales bacterium]
MSAIFGLSGCGEKTTSTLRRGVPAAHVVFGVAAAINAGTAAYFHCQRII